MARLELNLLGGFRAVFDSGAPCALPTKKAQALLAYLALTPGRAYSRDGLASLLWGDRGGTQARRSLRQTFYELRRTVPDAGLLLDVEGEGIALNPGAVDADVPRFERLVREATPEALERAAALYRGHLLHGFILEEAAFEEWLVVERERLRELATDALTKLLAHQARTGETERAIQTAARVLALDPLQEAVHRTLMQLYARQGRRATALRQYQTCVDVLQRELRVDPEAETKRLYQELLQQRLGTRSRTVDAASAVPPGFGTELLRLPGQDTPLVGRHAELDRLRALSRRAEDGRGHVAIVLGEAGIGKSRLLTQVALDALDAGDAVLAARAFESEQMLAFGPWVSAIRESRILEAPGRLATLAPIWRAELARLFPEIGDATEPGRPRHDYLRLFEAIERLLATVAEALPTVLLLDDLHWADEMSIRLLAYIGRRTRAWRLLVVGSVRREELPTALPLRGAITELLREERCTQVVLEPLTRPDTIQLVRALTRSPERLPSVIEEQICVASEGNPFMAVEMIRAFEHGAKLSPTTPLSAPERVRALITDRLDRLGERAQAVAAIAAVIGREFEFDLLQGAAGLSGRETAEAVEELVRRRVLQVTGERLDFTHDRIREVAYERLLPSTRQLLHRGIVCVLEAMPSRDEHAERLAHHAVRGDLREKAIHYLRQTGVRAAARSALSDSRACFEEALSILEGLPASHSSLERGFDIRIEMRPVVLMQGELRMALTRLREAEAVAESLNDDARRGRAHGHRTVIHSLLGELPEAVESGRRALEIAGRLGDLRLQIVATTHLGQAHHLRGEYEKVVALARANLAVLPGDWGQEHLGLGARPGILDRVWLVWTFADLGRFTEASEYEAETSALAESTQHAFTITAASLAACALHLLRGEWREMLARSEHYVAVARSRHVVLMLPTGLALSALALAHVGEASEASDRLREGATLLDRRLSGGIIGWSGWDYQVLGHAALALGRLDDALHLATRSQECSPSHPGFAAYALHLLGEIATHPARLDAGSGETHYRRALAIAEPLGMRPLVAHCHLGLARLDRRTGRHDRVHEHLSAATTMYRDMGIAYWLERSEGGKTKERGSPYRLPSTGRP